MTAQTAGRATQHSPQELLGVKVAAATKIYAGSIVCANANGYAVPGSTSTTLRFLGMAEETMDNTAGANGDQVVRVRRKRAFKWGNHGADLVTQADVGNVAYIVDDQTVAKTNGVNTRSAAGKVLGVEPDGVWIE